MENKPILQVNNDRLSRIEERTATLEKQVRLLMEKHPGVDRKFEISEGREYQDIACNEFGYCIAYLMVITLPFLLIAISWIHDKLK